MLAFAKPPLSKAPSLKSPSAKTTIIAGKTRLTLTDGTRVILEPSPKSLVHFSRELLQSWLEINVCAVRTYFGRFPVAEFSLVLKSVEGSTEISYGNAMPGAMPRITMYVGTRTAREEFRSSWVLCHELTHLAFPSLPREQRWIEEGMATYIEPIARAMTGIVNEESIWEEMMRKAPDAFRNIRTGLDGEHDYRRIYWGGAVFFLLADIEIRTTTNSKHSLQDAMQAILRSEGTMNTDRDVYSVLRAGDKAVSGRMLETLYEKFGKTAYTPDLERLWKDLGIERDGASVRFRDDAPLAAVRKAICTPSGKPCIDAAFKGK